MGILDNASRGDSPYERRIRIVMTKMMGEIKSRLDEVKSIVDDKGRSVVDADLETDAADFAALYAASKTFLEANSSHTIGDLPI
jgi:hypothetical protein